MGKTIYNFSYMILKTILQYLFAIPDILFFVTHSNSSLFEEMKTISRYTKKLEEDDQFLREIHFFLNQCIRSMFVLQFLPILVETQND